MSCVLIVDDNPADRALFRTVLSRAGFTVHELDRGSQVQMRAEELRPHIIVLDVNLPDINGHDVCRLLKSNPHLAGIPVLMLTVRGDEANVLAGLEAGADDYLAKNAPSPIILARVRRLVRYRQMATIAILNEQLAQVGRLLAGIVHEIRGPLTVIRGHVELLKMQITNHEMIQNCIEPILRNTQLLQSRLEYLMAAVRAGPPVMEDVAIKSLMEEAVSLFLKGSDPRSQALVVDTQFVEPLPTIKADPGRLIQVILNLLTNAREAILAVRPQGRIAVRVACHATPQGDEIQIDVADDGPGIPEVHLERIFEPFFTTKDQGSGYGLYLASELVREHGGSLSARNRPEGGACFTLRLPTGSPATATESS